MSVIYINPYSFAAPWTPANITTALWLDAADESTVSESGGAGTGVSEWRDKSGNTLHLTPSQFSGGTPTKPAYTSNALAGKPVITFSATTDILSRATGLNGLSNVTIISVFKIVSAVGSDDIPIALGSQTLNTARGFYRGASNVMAFLVYGSDWFSTLSWDVGGSYHIFGAMNTSLSGSGNVQLHRDGVVQTGTTPNSLLSTSAGFTVGNIKGGTSSFHPTNMQAAEVLVLSSAASTDTRQRIEGYLAHKWGLTGSLAADHPYKTTAPTA